MSEKFKFPKERAVIYWPIGTGDSTTLILKPGDKVMQIDLRHLEKAEESDEPEWPIIDHLVKNLPKKNGKPYLALFVLTHPDKDHIQGFAELLTKVHIGELWHTPRVFRDQKNQEKLHPDAKAFRKEAHRRRKAILADPGNIKSGNRLRVIGHDDILKEEDYKDLPEECKSRPGEKVWMVDGEGLSNVFQAFIHAPFKEDQAKDKNKTSLSLNIAIWEGEKYAQFFFFGDREYLTIKEIFDVTEQNEKNTGYLCWDVMLSAHHCSKGVMYYKGEDDEAEKFKKDIIEYFIKYKREHTGYIVSSSHSDFTDGEGDNPPHKKARNQYEKIVDAGKFICTHEHPSKKNPEPIVFLIKESGVELDDKREKSEGPSGLASSIASARGASQPSNRQIGQGK